MTPGESTCNKSCWFTDDYRRQCDDGRYDLMGKTAQECLEHCETHEYCYHAHWHPPNGPKMTDQSVLFGLLVPQHVIGTAVNLSPDLEPR